MPAYFLAIALTFFISGEPQNHFYPYIFFYTNLHQYFTNSWGPMAHLWTMSVEQQFYLLWPWVILYLPKKFILPAIISCIVIALIFQRLLPLNEFTFVLPFTCLDTIGFGALLAWIYDNKKAALPAVLKTLIVLSIIAVLIMIAQSFWYFPLILFPRNTVALITTALIIYFILYTNEKTKISKTVFENSFLLLIGRISYGVYLYHLMLFNYGYKWYYPMLGYIPFNLSPGLRFTIFIIINLFLLFVMAFLSWKYFEQPISDLKKYFKTGAKKEAPQLAVNK
jgi:peptidoglycan/LPS O-acetylase OafA/YrhL